MTYRLIKPKLPRITPKLPRITPELAQIKNDSGILLLGAIILISGLAILITGLSVSLHLYLNQSQTLFDGLALSATRLSAQHWCTYNFDSLSKSSHPFSKHQNNDLKKITFPQSTLNPNTLNNIPSFYAIYSDAIWLQFHSPNTLVANAKLKYIKKDDTIIIYEINWL